MFVAYIHNNNSIDFDGKSQMLFLNISEKFREYLTSLKVYLYQKLLNLIRNLRLSL